MFDFILTAQGYCEWRKNRQMDLEFKIFPEVHPFPCILLKTSVIRHFSDMNSSVKSLDFTYFSKENSEGNTLLRVVFIKILAGDCFL